MRLFRNTTITLLVLACCSCVDKRDIIPSEKIENQFASGVVLIVTRYSFTMTMEDGTQFFFTDFDDEGRLNVTMNPDERPIGAATGTGFFISADGQIATNSHVAFPDIDKDRVLSYLHSASKNTKKSISDDITEMTGLLVELRRAAREMSEGVKKDEILEKIKSLEDARDKASSLLERFDQLRFANGTLNCDTEVGIAYNNTFIEKFSELAPCTQLKHSKENDVAIIQLNSKQTPSNCFIFDVEVPLQVNGEFMPNNQGKPIDVDNLPVGTHLYMIGFNKGFTMGSTKEGIKAQMTSGKLSQTVDDVELMYTIPSLQGSSGSPVINDYGDLVAVNHAGWVNTQNFNYGIRVKHLRDLVHQKK